jgi:hypothetical protein
MWVVGFSNFFRCVCVTRATGSLTAVPSGNVNVRYTSSFLFCLFFFCFFFLFFTFSVCTCFPVCTIDVPLTVFFSSLSRGRD